MSQAVSCAWMSLRTCWAISFCTTSTAPTPQLKVRAISSSERFPSLCSQLKISGIFQVRASEENWKLKKKKKIKNGNCYQWTAIIGGFRGKICHKNPPLPQFQPAEENLQQQKNASGQDTGKEFRGQKIIFSFKMVLSQVLQIHGIPD